MDRVDGCVGSLDTDALSMRQSTSLQEQPHQNNPLLGLPIVAIENILNFLSYDEISMLRSVSRNTAGQLEGGGANASPGQATVLPVGLEHCSAGLSVTLVRLNYFLSVKDDLSHSVESYGEFTGCTCLPAIAPYFR